MLHIKENMFESCRITFSLVRANTRLKPAIVRIALNEMMEDEKKFHLLLHELIMQAKACCMLKDSYEPDDQV